MVGLCVKMLAMPIITIQELMGPHAKSTVAAFNVITIEHAEGIVAGAERAGLPVILQLSENAIKYHGQAHPPSGRVGPSQRHLDRSRAR